MREWRTTGISGRRASAPRGTRREQAAASLRGGYALGYDFINAQFHLNTSVAQPWGAEVRLADGQLLDDPFTGSGVTNPFPYTLGKDSPFNLFGPYISIPPDIKTPRQQSWNLTFQQQLGRAMAVNVSYLGSLQRPAVERPLAQRRSVHTRVMHTQHADRSPDVQSVHDGGNAQFPPQDHHAELGDRQISWCALTSTPPSVSRHIAGCCWA